MFPLINYYFYEKTYRISYTLICFLWFFQLFFNYKIELLYLLTTNLNYPYFIVYKASDLFFLSISTAAFLSTICCIPFIYWQTLLYLKTTLTKTVYKIVFNRYFYRVIYYVVTSALIIFIITPVLWNLFLLLEVYNTSLLIEVTPQITNYFEFLQNIFITWWVINTLSYILLIVIPKYQIPKDYLQLLYARLLIYPSITLLYSAITPPDLFTLLIVLIPFILVYELFLFLLLYQTHTK